MRHTRKSLMRWSEFNQSWAKSAPVLVLSVAKKTFTAKGIRTALPCMTPARRPRLCRFRQPPTACTPIRWRALIAEQVRASFAIPVDYEIGAVTAVGYFGDPASLPEHLRKMEVAPRQRKPSGGIRVLRVGEAGATLSHGRVVPDEFSMRKFLLLSIPFSSKPVHGAGILPACPSFFREAGAAIDILETGENRAAGAKAKRAVAQGYDAMVVCGGDGTIFDVIQGIAGSRVASGHHSLWHGQCVGAKFEGPQDPVAAAHWILRSRPIPVPLGKITCGTPEGRQSWLFAMAAGMGMHAALMSEARCSGKSATGRAAYFVAGGRLLLNHPVQPFDIAITTLVGQVQRGTGLRGHRPASSGVEPLAPGRWSGLSLPSAGHGARRILASVLAQAAVDALFRSAGGA